MDGEFSSSEVEYVDLTLVLTRQFRLYRVAASTFKMDGADRWRFEWSSSSIWPKRLVCQSLYRVSVLWQASTFCHTLFIKH